MIPFHRLSARLAWLFLALLLLPAGCSRGKLRLPVVQNLRPVAKLTFAPASTTEPSYYACDLYWTGSDADGYVDHYLYCLDPPTRAGADTPWVATTENRIFYTFRCDNPDPPGSLSQPQSYHVFVLKAVDNLGAVSAPEVDAFSSFTVAPSVTIISPQTANNSLIWPTLPANAAFTFTGTDPDGRTTSWPVKYKYKLFPDKGGDFDFHSILIQPDLLRKYYAPAFAGWDSISGDTCQVVERSMIPGTEYVFAVVAIDEAGAYSPVFTLGGNLFRFGCGFAGVSGPRMMVWNEYFHYRYISGGYNPDPTTAIQIEVPAGRNIDFNWSAVPLPGAQIKSFRWAIDIAALDDETRRSNEATDWNHWSSPSVGATSCLVGPFVGAGLDSLEQHTIYIEAEDTNMLKSLAMVQFRVTRPGLNKDLLFVDDTRFWPDQLVHPNLDSLQAPGGNWPDAAELDTFLFARGGVRWRYYRPATTTSPPGVFNGYTFDTLATRRFASTGGIPLWLLGNYRHVVWICDPATTYNDLPTGVRSPMPLLRWMSMGTANILANYSLMGGSLWLMGGGIAYNTLKPFNVTSNDPITAEPVFSRATGELVTGRIMYDLPHWQTEISVKQPVYAYSNYGFQATWPGAPDYSKLRRLLMPRTDPVPPMRNSLQFSVSSYVGEVLSQPTRIIENMSSDPDRDSLVSVLDTLYFGYYGDTYATLPPVMTYYHGKESGPVMFSGFPLWYFQRAQAIELSDFVLQDVWGLHRAPLPR